MDPADLALRTEELAKRYGLDTFDILFELVDYNEINEIAVARRSITAERSRLGKT